VLNSVGGYSTQSRGAWGATSGRCDWARRKRSRVGREHVPNGARQGTSQVVLGIGMGARKSRTGQMQHGFHRCLWHTTLKQSFSNPQVGNAPIGTRKALRNLQLHETGLIEGDGGGDTGAEGVVMNVSLRWNRDRRTDSTKGGWRRGTRGRIDQGTAIGRQTGLGNRR
jgi:hypothetical protein